MILDFTFKPQFHNFYSNFVTCPTVISLKCAFYTMQEFRYINWPAHT